MRKIKRIISLVLAFVMVAAMLTGYDLNVNAADQRDTSVASFAAFNNSGAGFIEFSLANGDWQTAESLTAPGVTWMENNYLYNVIFYQGEDDTVGTSLLDAIRNTPTATDLDGVKRRTRAQMGRCQGGFCSPYIIELLSKELNLPYEKITKSGGNSYVAVGKTKEIK